MIENITFINKVSRKSTKVSKEIDSLVALEMNSEITDVNANTVHEIVGEYCELVDQQLQLARKGDKQDFENLLKSFDALLEKIQVEKKSLSSQNFDPAFYDSYSPGM